MKRRNSILLWLLAVVLTLVIGVYQRMTGPTYPVKGKETFKGREISYRLLRTQTIKENLPVKIKAAHKAVTAYINHRHYKTDESWQEVEMKRQGDLLVGEIPAEEIPAAKVEYTIRVSVDQENFLVNKGKTIVARFKGQVPSVFLIVHVLFMSLSIVFALRTGMEALRKAGSYHRLVNWTLVFTFIGGLILGPVVQYFAFGDLWTGFPFGFDLTDNKTLVAVVFWLLAFFLKKKSRWWVILAAVVMIAVYLVPHSLLGSELDYQTGQMRNKYSIIMTETYPPAPHWAAQ